MQLDTLFRNCENYNDFKFAALLCEALGEDDVNYCYVIKKLTRIYGQRRMIDWMTTAIERRSVTNEANTYGGMLVKVIRQGISRPVWKNIFSSQKYRNYN